MTAKQKLKMAEQQLAYWKQQAADAKAALREAERVRGKKLRPKRKAAKKSAQRKARKTTRRARAR